MFKVAAVVIFDVFEAVCKLRTALLQRIELLLRLTVQLGHDLHACRRKETLLIDVFFLFFVAVLAAVLRGFTRRLNTGDGPVVEHSPTPGATGATDRTNT